MELVFDFFEDHVKAADAVKARRPLALGFFCLGLGTLSFFVAMALSGRLGMLPFGWIGFSLLLLWEIGAALLLAAVLHLIVDFQGRQGSVSELFILFGMANLIWGLAVPLALVFMAMPGAKHWPSAAFLLIGLANLSLKARSLKDTYRVSTGRAWVTLALPYLFLLFASGLAVSLAMASIFIQLVKVFNG